MRQLPHHRSNRASHNFGLVQEWHTAREQWTFDQWQALCAVLFNGNSDPHEFLLCHENTNERLRFNKAKRAILAWHIEQTYYSVAQVTELKRGIGFYPCNQNRESFWGALDFDAHDDGQPPEQAREFAQRAVELLARHSPTLAAIACTSGKSGGWHVFIFRRHPRPIAEWTAFLCDLAQKIGAIVATPAHCGHCDLHPHQTTERPRGLRAPGSLNPKDGSFGLIAYDSLTPRLGEWKELLDPSLVRALSCADRPKKDNIVFGKLRLVEQRLTRQALAKFRIHRKRTRHKRLLQLVGWLVNQCGRALALEVVKQQYKQAVPRPKTAWKEHFREFEKALADCTKKEVAKFSEAQRAIYDALKVPTDREAFLILLNWHRAPQWKGDGFQVSSLELATRLGMTTLQGACQVRNRFCAKGILRKTADYVRPKGGKRGLSTTYQWLVE